MVTFTVNDVKGTPEFSYIVGRNVNWLMTIWQYL